MCNSAYLRAEKRRRWRSGLAATARSIGRVLKSWMCPLLSIFLISHDRDTYCDRAYSFVIYLRNVLNIKSMFLNIVITEYSWIERQKYAHTKLIPG